MRSPARIWALNRIHMHAGPRILVQHMVAVGADPMLVRVQDMHARSSMHLSAANHTHMRAGPRIHVQHGVGVGAQPMLVRVQDMHAGSSMQLSAEVHSDARCTLHANPAHSWHGDSAHARAGHACGVQHTLEPIDRTQIRAGPCLRVQHAVAWGLAPCLCAFCTRLQGPARS
jgi:hypothetical protein